MHNNLFTKIETERICIWSKTTVVEAVETGARCTQECDDVLRLFSV